MMIEAPARASPCAMASPSPEPPPVTSARRSVSSKGWVEARGRIELAQAEHVLHIEQTRHPRCALLGNEARRPQRAMREIRTRTGLVRELDSLARTGEDDLVLAHHVATSQGREPDRPRLALAGHAFTCEHGVAFEIVPERPRRRFAKVQSRPRWRV